MVCIRLGPMSDGPWHSEFTERPLHTINAAMSPDMTLLAPVVEVFCQVQPAGQKLQSEHFG